MLLNSNGRGRLLRKIKTVKFDFYIRNLAPTLWLDASNASTIILNGDKVAEWRDLSGNNIHAVQSNATKQPTYVPNSVNGLSAIYFNELQLNFLSCGDADLLDLNAQDLFSIAVCRAKQTGVIFGKDGISGGGRYYVVSNTSTSIVGYMFNSSGGGSARQISSITSATEYMLCGQIIDYGVSHTSHANGVLSPTAAFTAPGDNNAVRFILGAKEANSSTTENEHLDGEICELIILRSLPTTEQRQLLEGKLAYKWGTTARLPSDHPYKDIPPTDNYITIKYISYQIVDAENGDKEQHITFEVKRHTPYGISSINYAVEGAGSDPAISSDFVGDVYPSGSIDFSANPYNLVIATKANSYRSLLVRLTNPINSIIGISTAAASIVKALRYTAFLHLDAANTDTFQLSGNLITQWNDVSGNNYHAVAITSGREPVYDAIDKKVVFANDRLRFPSMADPGDILDVFFIFDHTYLMGLFDAAPGSSGRIGNLSLGAWSRHGGSIITLNVPASTLCMIYVSHTASSMRYYRDGGFITSVSSGAFAWSLGNVQIGGVNSGFEFVGSIREIVFFNRNLSDQERQLMESDLTHKWGIAGRLPSDHPYKNTPAP